MKINQKQLELKTLKEQPETFQERHARLKKEQERKERAVIRKAEAEIKKIIEEEKEKEKNKPKTKKPYMSFVMNLN